MSKTTNTPLENMRRLNSAKYIVWTQAGFKRAIKELRRRYNDDECPVESYPKQYPCVVTFHSEYRGYTYWHAQCEPLSSVIEETRKVLEFLISADTEHQAAISAIKTEL